MNNHWLLLDVSNLAYRAFYSMGYLSNEGEPTSIVFGVFRDILKLQKQFQTSNVAFAFDGGHDHRAKLFPMYKQVDPEQEKLPEEQQVGLREVRRQIYRLRTKFLPAIGYKNILWEECFEADDLIASVCENQDRTDFITIVSSDADLYQCLSPTVQIWSPNHKRIFDVRWFADTWGISPSQWADVKALAGCKSDCLPGIKGIAEKRASQFIAGTMKHKSKAFQSIILCRNVWTRNLPLTKLPFEGTPKVQLMDDSIDPENWDNVMESLGIRTLYQGKRRRQR